MYDSSCSKEAKVLFIDKGPGYFLKETLVGPLKSESLMHEYFHGLHLTSRMVTYHPDDQKGYMITERVPGEDCTHSLYLSEPEKLVDTYAAILRMLHEQPIENCPLKDRNSNHILSVLDQYASGAYEGDLFEGLWEFKSDQEAWEYAKRGMGSLERETLIHGDYCLPNIMLDKWKFSGFIDLGHSGVSDRHVDLVWGIWTLKFNLGTTKYTDRFIDAYGRDKVNREKLRCIAAMEMF